LEQFKIFLFLKSGERYIGLLQISWEIIIIIVVVVVGVLSKYLSSY